MTRNAVTLDPKGFLGDSFYVSSLNGLVQQYFEDDACTAHVNATLKQGTSKRPQPKLIDIPSNITSQYVFIPTQKFADVSVERYSNISYPELLMAALHFCKGRRLSLVIKIHPHVKGDERDRQEQFVERMQRQYERVYESRASISFLTANALFTVTLNGGTLMDNFYTGSPVLSLARGFFHETEAVVYDTDAAKGMARMLDRGELPWPERRVRRQRQVACWYDRMCLKTTRTPSENVAVIQAHLDLNQVGKVVL
jgi:hypothetical protein